MSKIGAIAQSDTSIITDGLIYNLDFSKFSCFPRTGTTVTDLVGSLTATNNNGASFTSNDLGAFDFDAVDDQIDCGKPAILESYPLSIEVWFKSGNNNTGIVSKGRTRGSSSQRDLDITGTGTDIRFLISNGSGYNFILDATYPSLNIWHHLVCMWDGTTTTNGAKMYLDGDLYAQATSTGTSFATGDNIFIGGNRSGFFFDGPIAVTRFYNRSLSGVEVSINYNALKERFGL
tara:strand:- start:186 stop:884 length:699 start_codon:yes stop_codon:yes gene_type:complete